MVRYIERWEKARDRFEADTERFRDECARLTELWCVEQSYKWPKRTLTLLTGNGRCCLTVKGKRLRFEFALDNDDDKDIDIRHQRGWRYWRESFRRPDLGVLTCINQDYPNDYVIGGTTNVVEFRNGRKKVVKSGETE